MRIPSLLRSRTSVDGGGARALPEPRLARSLESSPLPLAIEVGGSPAALRTANLEDGELSTPSRDGSSPGRSGSKFRKSGTFGLFHRLRAASRSVKEVPQPAPSPEVYTALRTARLQLSRAAEAVVSACHEDSWEAVLEAIARLNAGLAEQRDSLQSPRDQRSSAEVSERDASPQVAQASSSGLPTPKSRRGSAPTLFTRQKSSGEGADSPMAKRPCALSPLAASALGASSGHRVVHSDGSNTPSEASSSDAPWHSAGGSRSASPAMSAVLTARVGLRGGPSSGGKKRSRRVRLWRPARTAWPTSVPHLTCPYPPNHTRTPPARLPTRPPVQDRPPVSPLSPLHHDCEIASWPSWTPRGPPSTPPRPDAACVSTPHSPQLRTAQLHVGGAAASSRSRGLSHSRAGSRRHAPPIRGLPLEPPAPLRRCGSGLGGGRPCRIGATGGQPGDARQHAS